MWRHKLDRFFFVPISHSGVINERFNENVKPPIIILRVKQVLLSLTTRYRILSRSRVGRPELNRKIACLNSRSIPNSAEWPPVIDTQWCSDIALCTSLVEASSLANFCPAKTLRVIYSSVSTTVGSINFLVMQDYFFFNYMITFLLNHYDALGFMKIETFENDFSFLFFIFKRRERL